MEKIDSEQERERAHSTKKKLEKLEEEENNTKKRGRNETKSAQKNYVQWHFKVAL